MGSRIGVRPRLFFSSLLCHSSMRARFSPMYAWMLSSLEQEFRCCAWTYALACRTLWLPGTKVLLTLWNWAQFVTLLSSTLFLGVYERDHTATFEWCMRALWLCYSLSRLCTSLCVPVPLFTFFEWSLLNRVSYANFYKSYAADWHTTNFYDSSRLTFCANTRV